MSKIKKNYDVLMEIDLVNADFKNKKFIEFRTSVYNNRYLQIRQYKKTIKFYEIDMEDDKEISINKDLVEWLILKKRFSKEDRKRLKKFLEHMIIEGQCTMNYTLNGQNKRINVKINLKPTKGLIESHQSFWYAEGTINGKPIDKSKLEGCVNAQLVAEDIAEEKIKELREKHGKSLRVKNK